MTITGSITNPGGNAPHEYSGSVTLPPGRPSDIATTPGTNTVLLVVWGVACIVGFAVIFLAKALLAGVAIIALPTFVGMAIKPTFGMSVALLVLPTGAGVAVEGVFSLDRGVGIALGLSFLLNIMGSRPHLRISNKALWFFLLYSLWIFLSVLWAYEPEREIKRIFAQFQLMIYVFILYWIVQSNGEYCLRWALRSYVAGTLVMLAIARFRGSTVRVVQDADRFTQTAGLELDPNFLATIMGLAFLSALYLYVKDKKFILRLMYLAAMVVLPVMMINTGSRGAMAALAFTMLSPVLFLRQVFRKPAILGALLLCILLVSGAVGYFASRGAIFAGAMDRVTDTERAEGSLAYRLDLMKTAFDAAVSNPQGTTYSGWLDKTRSRHFPHSDFFYVLGLYGFPGAFFFALFLLAQILTVRRMPMCHEKLFARAILTFLIFMGLSLGQVFAKHYWVFMVMVMASLQIAHQHEADQKAINEQEKKVP